MRRVGEGLIVVLVLTSALAAIAHLESVSPQPSPGSVTSPERHACDGREPQYSIDQQIVGCTTVIAGAYNKRGVAYGIGKEYKKAVADFDRAIQLMPDFAAAYSNRGKAYLELGDCEPAVADAEQAVRLDPQNKKLAANLAAAKAENESLACEPSKTLKHN